MSTWNKFIWMTYLCLFSAEYLNKTTLRFPPYKAPFFWVTCGSYVARSSDAPRFTVGRVDRLVVVQNHDHVPF